MEYKVVSVPAWAYQNGKKLQAEIIRRGLNSVPSEIREPSVCPWCGTQLEYIELKYRYAQCSKCGYKQQTFPAKSNVTELIAAVGLGAIIGLGIAELVKALNKQKKGGRQNV